jgi:hypothetical protein
VRIRPIFIVGFLIAAVVVVAAGYTIGRNQQDQVAVEFNEQIEDQGFTPTTGADGMPAGIPLTAVRVDTELGPIWVDGSFAYASDCDARGITEQTATDALTKAGRPPEGGFVTWGLGCS